MNALLTVIGFVCMLATSDAFSTINHNAITSTSQLDAATVPDDDDIWQGEDSAEETLPKYSTSIPFLRRPKELKFELAGDVGFDPLDLAKNRDLLMEYREAEIKHSRLAMLAAVGWPLSELYDPSIAFQLNMDPVLDANNRVPSLFNGGLERVSPVWWGFCLGLTAAIDLYGVNRSRTLPPNEYIPGNLGFDPLGLYPGKNDTEGRQKMELAEIKHGRLAMIAVTAFSVQEFVSGIGIVDETPIIFKPIDTLETVLGEVVNSSI